MAAQMDAFQQARDHLYIGQHGTCSNRRRAEHQVFQTQLGFHRQFTLAPFIAASGRPLPGFVRLIARRRRLATAKRVEPFLQPFPRRRLVIGRAALVATLLAMMFSAAERTAQIPAAGTAGMRQKADPTLNAESHAVLQPRMRPQDRVQRDLILPDKRPGAIRLMPILSKRENSFDSDDKKARLSVIT